MLLLLLGCKKAGSHNFPKSFTTNPTIQQPSPLSIKKKEAKVEAEEKLLVKLQQHKHIWTTEIYGKRKFCFFSAIFLPLFLLLNFLYDVVLPMENFAVYVIYAGDENGYIYIKKDNMQRKEERSC